MSQELIVVFLMKCFIFDVQKIFLIFDEKSNLMVLNICLIIQKNYLSKYSYQSKF